MAKLKAFGPADLCAPVTGEIRALLDLAKNVSQAEVVIFAWDKAEASELSALACGVPIKPRELRVATGSIVDALVDAMPNGVPGVYVTPLNAAGVQPVVRCRPSGPSVEGFLRPHGHSNGSARYLFVYAS